MVEPIPVAWLARILELYPTRVDPELATLRSKPNATDFSAVTFAFRPIAVAP